MYFNSPSYIWTRGAYRADSVRTLPRTVLFKREHIDEFYVYFQIFFINVYILFIHGISVQKEVVDKYDSFMLQFRLWIVSLRLERCDIKHNILINFM